MIDLPQISKAEWQVMQALWERHPATANEIVAVLEAKEPWKPNTIKTLINRLVQKKVVGFEKQGRAYLYYPLVSRKNVVQEESRGFLDRFFGGALKPMVASLIENDKLSKQEIEELRNLLDKAAEE